MITWSTNFASCRQLLAALVMLAAAMPAAHACSVRPGDAVATLKLPVRNEARHNHADYYAQLLALALEKTEAEYGDCVVQLVDEPLPAVRLLRNLAEKNNADILDATSSPERSREFRTVPIPLLKGLMGYRIAFVRAEDQQLFAQVDSLEQLRRYSAGQGAHWPDVATLKSNGIEVVTAHNYESLFRMLQVQRFDYFPRGAQEILDEKEQFETEGLVIEPHLILAYPSPVYFHVHRDNHALAQRVELGLLRAIEDGSFDRLFASHDLIVSLHRRLALDKRRTIYMCNPSYRQLASVQDSRLWIRPWPADLCRT